MSSDPEDTLPPQRRSGDKRIDQIERKLDDNTTMTAAHGAQIAELRTKVNNIDHKTDALLEMKTAFDNHLNVLCTWARWGKNAIYGALGIAGLVLPVYVAAKQLGWL